MLRWRANSLTPSPSPGGRGGQEARSPQKRNDAGNLLGQGQVAKYDIETWMPSRNSYGETHSASRFYDFQARRCNMRYKTADGKTVFCHTLNNTVIASPRILIPIIETYQNADGSITVPEALRGYCGGLERIEAKK